LAPLLVTICALFLPALSFGGGWGTVQDTEIERIQREEVFCNTDVVVTGSADVGLLNLNLLTEGDSITTATLVGCRTITAKYTDNDAEVALDPTVVKITGRNQFGGISQETFTFSGDGTETATGRVPFVANPGVTIAITSLDSDTSATTDTISLYSGGFGLKSNPQDSEDVLSELSIVDTTYTEETQEAGWTFSSSYDTLFSVYKNTDLTAGDRVLFLFATTADDPDAVGPGWKDHMGTPFTYSSTGE